MRSRGYPPTLVASHPENRNREVHAVYSSRAVELTPEARQLVESIMALPHVVPADRLGAERIAALTVQLGRIEAALADGLVENKRGQPRTLIDHHRRLSAELREWLDRYGLTPRGRADWARSLAGGSVMDAFRRRLAELEGGDAA